MSPRSLVKAFRTLKEALGQKSKIIKRLHTKQRQQNKIKSLQHLLSELSKRELLSHNAAAMVKGLSNEHTIVQAIVENGKINGQYSPQLRAFALMINFYSPKAYKYVRSAFQNRLPAPSTIRSWYSTTTGSPGCTQEAVNVLRNKVKAAGDKILYGCLTVDEMAIRQEIDFNHSEKRLFGYVDYGHAIQEPTGAPIASHALVYLVTGMNERWKIPVAYFLVDGLTASE